MTVDSVPGDAIVGSLPTIAVTSADVEAAARKLSVLSYSELSEYLGITADQLDAFVVNAFGDVKAPVSGLRRPEAASKTLSPVAGVSFAGPITLIDQIAKQRDPGRFEKELKIEPVTSNQSKDGSTFDVEVTIAGLARTEVVTTTISTSGTTTTSASSPKGSGMIVDDIQLGIVASSCPDANGSGSYTVTYSSQSTLSMSTGEGVSQNTEMKVTGTTTTNDDGALGFHQMDLSVATELRPMPGSKPVPDQGDGYGLTGSYTVGFGNGTASGTGGEGSYDGLKGSDEYSTLLVSNGRLVGVFGIFVANAMEEAWKSGLCVEARIDDGASRDVSPGETVKLLVAARHRVDEADVTLPIAAELAGAGSLEPAGKRLPSPAEFAYTAGANQNDIGKVTSKVISKRGISKPVTTEYTVRSGFSVNETGYSGAYAITGNVCDPKVPFVLAWDGGQISLIVGSTTFTPGDPEGATGTWTFDGLNGGLIPVSASGSYTLSTTDRGLLLTSQNWTIDAPFVGSLPLGPGGQHINIAVPIELRTDPPPQCTP